MDYELKQPRYSLADSLLSLLETAGLIIGVRLIVLLLLLFANILAAMLFFSVGVLYLGRDSKQALQQQSESESAEEEHAPMLSEKL